MAETSKAVSSEKTVPMPDMDADCSRAGSITAEGVGEMRAKAPAPGGGDLARDAGRGGAFGLGAGGVAAAMDAAEAPRPCRRHRAGACPRLTGLCIVGKRAVLEAVRARATHVVAAETRANRLDQFEEVLAVGGAAAVLPDTLRVAVGMVGGRRMTEAAATSHRTASPRPGRSQLLRRADPPHAHHRPGAGFLIRSRGVRAN